MPISYNTSTLLPPETRRSPKGRSGSALELVKLSQRTVPNKDKITCTAPKKKPKARHPRRRGVIGPARDKASSLPSNGGHKLVAGSGIPTRPRVHVALNQLISMPGVSYRSRWPEAYISGKRLARTSFHIVTVYLRGSQKDWLIMWPWARLVISVGPAHGASKGARLSESRNDGHNTNLPFGLIVYCARKA